MPAFSNPISSYSARISRFASARASINCSSLRLSKAFNRTISNSLSLTSPSRNSSFNWSCEYRGCSAETIAYVSSGRIPRCPFMRAACISLYSLPCPFISTMSAKTSMSDCVYMRVLFLPGVASGLRYAENSLEYVRTDSREILNRFAVWIAFHMRNIVTPITVCYQMVTEYRLKIWQVGISLLQSVAYCVRRTIVRHLGGCNHGT